VTSEQHRPAIGEERILKNAAPFFDMVRAEN